MAAKTPKPQKLTSSLAEKGRFVIAGVINTVTDFTVLNILVSFAGLPLYGANLISAFVAMCVSFVLNKNFVFKKATPGDARAFFTFIGVTLLSIWGVQTLVIFLLTQQFPEPLYTIADAAHSAGLPQSFSIEFLVNNMTKIIATIASLIWNYLFYKYVVFAPKRVEHEDQP